MDRAYIVVVTIGIDENCIQPLHLIATTGMVAVEVRSSDVRCFRCAVSLWAVLMAGTAFSLPIACARQCQCGILHWLWLISVAVQTASVDIVRGFLLHLMFCYGCDFGIYSR